MGFILNLWGFCCKNEKFVSVTFSLKNNCSHFPIFRKMEVSAWEFSSFNFSTPKSHQKLVLKHLSPTTTMIIAETCRTRIWISNVAFGCLNRPACLQSRRWFSGQNEHGNHFIRRRCPRRSENPWFLPNYSRCQAEGVAMSWCHHPPACPAHHQPWVSILGMPCTNDCAMRPAPWVVRSGAITIPRKTGSPFFKPSNNPWQKLDYIDHSHWLCFLKYQTASQKTSHFSPLLPPRCKIGL